MNTTWLLRVAAVLCAPSLAGWAPAETPPRPNVLLILTDDQGWGTLSCYGNRMVETRNLDRLAAEGMRFTDAYAMPQCTPTRAALLTGQHTARNGMWHVIPWYGYPRAPVAETPFLENLPRETFTVAKGLRAAGYRTASIGKWHLTTGRDGDYVRLRPEAAEHYGFDYAAPAGPGSIGTGDKQVNYFTDEAIRFIEANRERPWFCYLAHHTIHGPVSAPQELVARYRAQGHPAEGMHNATYLAAIEHLDTSIGRLMAGIDRLGLRERTVVIFTSDNGGVDTVNDMEPFTNGPGTATRLTPARQEFDNAPLRAGKGSQYEGGIRVPCLVRWPGVVRPGSSSPVPIHVIDWLPTLLEIAGASAPPRHAIDGVSLVPLLRGEPLAERALCWYLPFYELRFGATPCAIIRRGDSKLIEYFGDWFDDEGEYVPGHRIELYDLCQDIGETNNLAASQPEEVNRLRDELRRWMKSIPVPAPGKNPAYDPSRALQETKEKPSR